MMDVVIMLKWCIYVVSALVMVLSIVTITVDEQDNAVYQAIDSKLPSYLLTNIFLMLLMIASAAPAIYHYWSPRLVWILLMVVLSWALIIVRLCCALHLNIACCGIVILNALMGGGYIYLVAFLKGKKEPGEGLLTTFIKMPDYVPMTAGSDGAKDGGDSKLSQNKKRSESKNKAAGR